MNELINTQENKELNGEISVVEQTANEVVVNSDETLQYAQKVAAEIAKMKRTVEAHWKPLKQQAKATHDMLVAGEKEMLNPLKSAEATVKGKMSDYLIQKELERRQREAELRRQAEEEMKRKLAEAAEAESAGDALGAEMAMAEAEVMDDMSKTITIQQNKPKVDGMSQRKGWEIVSIDPDKVPVSLNGMVIRPVDEKAVMALIKASKGQIKIDGITYKETTTVCIRS